MDFAYKHDAKHTSMVVLAQLWAGDSDDFLMDYLDAAVTRCNACEFNHIFLK